MGTYVCSPCALGNCDDCPGRVHSGQATKRCACRHGAARPLARTSDPRAVGPGAIISDDSRPGTALLDARHAVLVDESTVAKIDNPSDGRTVIAMLLEGRVNQTPDRTSILYLLNGDNAAALVTQLVGLAARMGPDFEAEFRASLDHRMATEDLWPSVAPAGGADA